MKLQRSAKNRHDYYWPRQLIMHNMSLMTLAVQQRASSRGKTLRRRKFLLTDVSLDKGKSKRAQHNLALGPIGEIASGKYTPCVLKKQN